MICPECRTRTAIKLELSENDVIDNQEYWCFVCSFEWVESRV